MKAVVSGADGNLGKHICRHFPGEIYKLGRTGWCDDFSGADVFIHCAYDLQSSYLLDPEKVLDSNVTSVGLALKICTKYGLNKFIFISSCSVYGVSSQTREDVPLAPITVNGYSKQIGEKIVKDYCVGNGIDYLILRPFNTYGGDDRFSVVSKMISAAMENKVFMLVNNGRAERDFIHIDDLAQVVCKLAILDDLKNQIINVGSGMATRIIDIVRVIENEYGRLSVDNKYDANEVAYSCADLGLLNSIINYKFRDILEEDL